MIHQTRGVVLNHVKYGESSVIVHIYTESFGRQSYLINNVRSAKSKGKTIFLQPLALLDLQVYHSHKKEVQRVKDFKIACPFASIPFDQTKRSISFFVTEVMNRALREEESNPELFEFIYDSVRQFDGLVDYAKVFHLVYMAKLTRYLGFFPDFGDDEPQNYFDLRNGCCCSLQPAHNHCLTNQLLADWLALFQQSIEVLDAMPTSRRNQLADSLLDYFALHLEGFGSLRSFDVLKDYYNFG